MESMEKGETIIATSPGYISWTTNVVTTLIGFIGVFFLFIKEPPLILSLVGLNLNAEMLRWNADARELVQWTQVLGVMMICMVIVIMTLQWLNSKSHVAVHEKCVTGYTCALAKDKNPQAAFELTYDEIIGVRDDGKSKRLVIQTVNRTYEVFAVKNRAEAVAEIRKRARGESE